MYMRSRKMIPLFATLVTLGFLGQGVAARAADSDLWLHVRVDEGGRGGAKVSVNVPFSLISVALPMLDIDEHIHDHSVHFDGHELTFDEMRDLWQEVRNGPDMNFVTVEEDDESVRVWKESGYLFVQVRDRFDDKVDIKAPLAVVDALLSGDEDFDLEAAVEALADQGEGELVTVQDNEELVRVWVDSSPEPGD
jgi:hypothetical protein